MKRTLNINRKKLLIFLLSLLLSLIGIVTLTNMGVNIPILREIIGFVFLTFVPGFVILNVLKINRLTLSEFVLYLVGLSIAFIMFIGLILNTFHPIISNPISTGFLLASIIGSLLILFLIVYYKKNEITIEIPAELPSSRILLLFLLPILSIFSTYLINFHQIIAQKFVLIFAIAIIVCFISFDKYLKKGEFYGLAILMSSLTLLFLTTLIGSHINGSDIHVEYYFANRVFENSYWDSTIQSEVNGMLSVSMIAPIFSKILNINLIWTFKIVYPLIFSLVPLGLYVVLCKQIGKKMAFLSSFFFMSFMVFFGEMMQLARQQIAEIFFILIMLLLIDEKIGRLSKTFLFIVFGWSMVVSHYGLSYIYMFYILAFIFLFYMLKGKIFKNRFIPNFKKKIAENIPINLGYATLFVVLTIAWYLFISSSSSFNLVIGFGKNVFNGLSNFWVASARSEYVIATFNITAKYPLIATIGMYVCNITKFFICIGFLWVLIQVFKVKGKNKGNLDNDTNKNFNINYFLMTCISMFVLVLSIALPYFIDRIRAPRMYHVVLFFLAPLCIIGGIIFFKWLIKIFPKIKYSKNVGIKLLTLLILIPYFFFNLGFFQGVLNPTLPSEIPFSDYLSKKEVNGGYWLMEKTTSDSIIYAGLVRNSLFSEKNRMRWLFYNDTDKIRNDAYIFLNEDNVRRHEIAAEFSCLSGAKAESIYDSIFYKKIIIKSSKIYDNSGSQAFYYKKEE